MALPWHQTSEEKRRFQMRGTRAAQTLTSIWASALRACTRLRFRSTSESKSPDERSKMREWSFWGGRREEAKHKHLSDIQQISIFEIPLNSNSAVKFQGKWRAWGKRGFVLIWNVAFCAYFVQDFLSWGQIILHPKQTLLFLLVTLQLIITSHTTITNEHESHHYPQSLTGFRKKSIKMNYKINIYKSINMLMLFMLML